VVNVKLVRGLPYLGDLHVTLRRFAGLGGFVAASIAGWATFYVQSCNSAGQYSGFF